MRGKLNPLLAEYRDCGSFGTTDDLVAVDLGAIGTARLLFYRFIEIADLDIYLAFERCDVIYWHFRRLIDRVAKCVENPPLGLGGVKGHIVGGPGCALDKGRNSPRFLFECLRCQPIEGR